MACPGAAQAPTMGGQLAGESGAVRDDGDGGALASVGGALLQVPGLVLVQVVTPVGGVLDTQPRPALLQLAGAGEGVGVGGAGVAVAGVVPGQREDCLVITRALHIDLLREILLLILLLLDPLLALLCLPARRDEGAHLHVHRVQLGNARVNVHVP